MVPVWVESDLVSVSSSAYAVGENRAAVVVVVAYRPMDQIKIDVIDTEVLESRFEALSNALVEGVGELTRDLPKKYNQSERSLRDLSYPLTKISDRGTPD